MKRASLPQQYIAFVLLGSLFLQNCRGSSNLPIQGVGNITETVEQEGVVRKAIEKGKIELTKEQGIRGVDDEEGELTYKEWLKYERRGKSKNEEKGQLKTGRKEQEQQSHSVEIDKTYLESSIVDLAEKAAEQGNVAAQRDMGFIYQNGRAGLPQDDKLAIEWFKKSAIQGYVYGQTNLAWMYYNGKGTARNYHEAFKWYQKAADQGHPNAQCRLGWMYQTGKGVKRDYIKAREWYEKAAAQGNAQAQFNLGEVYQNGWGISKDYAKALGWYQKAAEQGNVGAQHKLGEMYYYGQGIQKNYTRTK